MSNEHGAVGKPLGKPQNLMLRLVIALGLGAFMGGIGTVWEPTTHLLRAVGLAPDQTAAWAIAFNAVLVAALAWLAGMGPKPWRFAMFALCSAVVGLQVGTALAASGWRPNFAMGVDAGAALLIGAILLVCGALVGAGLFSRSVGVAMEIENSGPDRAMLQPATVSILAEGGLLCTLSVMSLLAKDSAGLPIVAVLCAVLLAAAVWGHVASWRSMDEMNRRVWMEGTGIGSAIFALIAFGWLVAETLGVVPKATLLGIITLYYATYLVGSIGLMGMRYPWMIQKASAQSQEGAA
jgi:hypothetical protein